MTFSRHPRTLLALLVSAALTASACGSTEAEEAIEPVAETTAATQTSTAPPTTVAAVDPSGAVAMPIDGVFPAGTYAHDLGDVRLLFETPFSLATVPAINSSAETLLLNELVQDAAAVIRFTHIAGLRTMDERLDPDRYAGSIPVDDIDTWVAENAFVVHDRQELEIAGFPATRVDLTLPEDLTPEDGNCAPENPVTTLPCVYLAAIPEFSTDPIVDLAPFTNVTRPGRLWVIDLGDGTAILADVRADAEVPDFMPRLTLTVEGMHIELDPEPLAAPEAPTAADLTITEAGDLLDVVIGTLESRDYDAAEAALGATGKWVDPGGGEHGADEIRALFASYSTIERVERTGDPITTSSGTLLFPVSDVFPSGAMFPYWIEVFATEAGELRLAVRLEGPPTAERLSLEDADAAILPVLAAFESGDHAAAAAALGEHGAWIEPGGQEYGAEDIAGFIAGFSDIARIEVTEEPYPAERGGWAYAVVDIFHSGRADLHFFMRVFTNGDGHVRMAVALSRPAEAELAEVGGSDSAAPASDGEPRCLGGFGTEDHCYTLGGVIGASEPLPLVVDLHGWTDSVGRHRERTGIEALATEEGFLVAWPAGPADSWNAGERCCGVAAIADRPDVAYLRAVVDAVVAEQNVDTGRIYFTGLSNGCAMAQRFALEASDLVTAVACASHFLISETETPADYEPVAILTMHGEADGTVEVDGGSSYAPEGATAFGNIEAWAERNGCVPEPIESEADSISETLFSSCAHDVETKMILVEDGGHLLYAGQDTDVDTIALAWDFLSRFER